MGTYGNFINKQDLPLSYYENIINEAYIGKTRAVLAIEDAFERLKRSYNPKKDYRFNKDYKDLCKAFEDAFGFEIFYMEIIPDANTMNAGTIPYTLRTDYIFKPNKLKKYVVATPEGGFKLKEGNGFCFYAVLYAGILLNENISAAELTGIFLHEVGHNFSTIISGQVKFFNSIAQVYPLIFSIFCFVYGRFNIKKSLENKQKTDKTKDKKYDYPIDDEFKGVVGIFLNLYYKIFVLTDKSIKDTAKSKPKKPQDKDFEKQYEYYENMKPNLFSEIVEKIISIILTIWRGSRAFSLTNLIDQFLGSTVTIGRKSDEIIADKFAAVYGYGAELSTGLAKVTKYSPSELTKILDKIPILGSFINIFSTTQNLLHSSVDEHPFTVQRLNSILNSLEIELAKCNNPKLKKSLEKDIETIKMSKDLYLQYNPNGTINEKELNSFYRILDKFKAFAFSKNADTELHNKFDDAISIYQDI